MFQTLIAATLAATAEGHGAIIHPPQWSRGYELYENYTFVPKGQKTMISTYNPLKTMKECPKGTIPSKRDSAGNSLGCYLSPGLAPGKGVDATFDHPWRAPGTAPITSPCGIDGGNPRGCPPGNPGWGNCNSGGHGHGTDGRLGFNTGTTTTWQAGSVQKVEWYVHANHNGGYSYRLCKKPRTAMEITEECFQKTTLKFTGNHLIKYHSALTPNKEIPAMDTTFAETPGQYWRRNPIPCCTWLSAGPSTTCPLPSGPQFTPAIGSKGEKLMGYGPFKDWNIEDKVIVPDLPSGDYILSWRWDTEEFAQVWTSCSNIRITGGGPVPPAPTPKPPAPTPTPTPGCTDQDVSCGSLAETYCGTAGLPSGNCLRKGCPEDTYTWELKEFSGGQCHFHCTCKNSEITV